MRRPLLIGSVALVLVASAFIVVALAAPRNAPLLQDPNEPNDNFNQATSLDIPVSVEGRISETADLDFFVMGTTVGREYEASIAIWDNEDFQLRIQLFNASQEYVKRSDPSASSTSLSWSASQDSYYIRVEAATEITGTTTPKYRLDVNQVAATPTPTPTPVPDPWDAYEPNNSLNDPADISIGSTLTDLNFWPHDVDAEDYDPDTSPKDVDVFRVWCKQGHRCRMETDVTNGVDTYVKVFPNAETDPNASPIAENDDYGAGLGSRVTWESNDGDEYKIWVENLDESPRTTTGQTYELSVVDLVATPAPTPTPGPTSTSPPLPTPDPEADSCEDNSVFDHACVLPVNKSKTFNLVPPFENGLDNDFYKIWVKPNLHFKCFTSNLAPGIDPNMIVFNGPSWDNAIGGNDDVEPGNYNSAFSYYATYEGWLYILIGTGDRRPPEIHNSNYTLRCDMWAPGTSTPTPTNTRAPTNTPRPTEEGETPTPTPTSAESPAATPTSAQNQNLTVRPLATPTPLASATATASSPRFVPISMLIYYDGNEDKQPGAGEGIAGVSARAYEVATGQLLAQGFTDEEGKLEFTVAAKGSVRVSVPFLGFSQLVAGDGASLRLRVPPQSPSGGSP